MPQVRSAALLIAATVMLPLAAHAGSYGEYAAMDTFAVTDFRTRAGMSRPPAHGQVRLHELPVPAHTVPEPASWLLLLAGAGLLLGRSRCRPTPTAT